MDLTYLPGKDLTWNLTKGGSKLESGQKRIKLGTEPGKDLTWNLSRRESWKNQEVSK